jgi:GntR family phosphonate transport system transcriptional regulator
VPYLDFPDFADRFAQSRSVTAVLRTYGIEDYERASTRVSARHADAEESAALRVAPGAILLVSEAVDADLGGKPLLYGLSRFPADLLELVV